MIPLSKRKTKDKTIKEKVIQNHLNNLCGSNITDMHVDLLNDVITLQLAIRENGHSSFQMVQFIDVSAFYYVKEGIENRFDFYDREKTYYLEMTSIDHVDKTNYDFQIKSSSDEEWSRAYNSDTNIVIEIWNSLLFIEARKIKLGDEIFNLKET